MTKKKLKTELGIAENELRIVSAEMYGMKKHGKYLTDDAQAYHLLTARQRGWEERIFDLKELLNIKQ